MISFSLFTLAIIIGLFCFALFLLLNRDYIIEASNFAEYVIKQYFGEVEKSANAM